MLSAGGLEFFPPDFAKFPSIKLAYQAGQRGGTLPAVLSAANEVAVESFVDGRIEFTHIVTIVEETLAAHHRKEVSNIGDVLEADRWARTKAESLSSTLAR